MPRLTYRDCKTPEDFARFTAELKAEEAAYERAAEYDRKKEAEWLASLPHGPCASCGHPIHGDECPVAAPFERGGDCCECEDADPVLAAEIAAADAADYLDELNRGYARDRR